MVENMSKMHNPAHPGVVLREWIAELTVTEAAERLGVDRGTLHRLLSGKSAVSAEMDIRLTKALGTTPGLWLNMQGQYDLWQAGKNFKGKVRRIITNKAA
jgi:antitoxin HigA-1